MSERIRSGSPDSAVEEERPPKAERRAAAKAAKIRAAEARRRRQAISGALAGLAVVAVIVAAVLFFGNSGGDDENASTAASGAPSAPANQPPAAPTDPANPAFPPLPDGADPALGSKPDAGPGAGELTELKATNLIEGTGPAAAAGQNITVNYVGVLYRTGEEFDASWNRGEPFSFQLGTGGVIPGWDQGLVGKKVGSRVQLDIPSNLAYGDNPEGGRPAGALRFIVDVLAVR